MVVLLKKMVKLLDHKNLAISAAAQNMLDEIDQRWHIRYMAEFIAVACLSLDVGQIACGHNLSQDVSCPPIAVFRSCLSPG